MRTTNYSLFFVLLSAVVIASCGKSGTDDEVSLDAGGSWPITQTTRLSRLSIGDGAQIIVPDGRDLTMTVDGVEMPVAPGEYEGDIVLTPAAAIVDHWDGMGTIQDYHYRAAVYVNDGAYSPTQSVAAAVTAGQVSDSAAEGVTIRSVGEKFMGIVVKGASNYHIVRPDISLNGNGVNDFAGYGAAIHIGGSSNVTVDGAKISNEGAVRTAIWVGNDANAVINGADIEVRNGELVPDYGWSWVTGPDGSGIVMMEVPWMLGIVGNNRATLAVGNAKVTYNDSHIKAQAWGAMSTDAVREVEVYVNNSHVEVVESGYGGYADGNSLVSYSGSTVDVADYGLIMSGGSGVITDGTVINSGRNAVMSHGGPRGTLTIDKGSVLNTGKAVIQLKSASPTILVDSAELNSANGIILQAMLNDDPNKMMNPGPSAPESGAPGDAPPGPGGPGGAPPAGEQGGPPGGAAFGPMGGKYSSADDDNDIDATFRNVTLSGDFLNTMPEMCGMNLVFENTQITGAISTAIPRHAVGPNGEELVMQDSKELVYLIGEQTQTPAASDYDGGADASFDGESSWTVDKTSYLSGLTLAEGATVSAPDGYVLAMTVDGKATSIAAGNYRGDIVLQVTEN